MPRDRDGIRVHEQDQGRYALVSRKRVKSKTANVVGELWDHDLDREAGDNDPHKNR